MLISAASSADRSLIRSAARRSTATRSGQGVCRQPEALAAATASSMSAAVASWAVHSRTERSPGLVTSKVGPVVRSDVPTRTGIVVPSQDLAICRPSSYAVCRSSLSADNVAYVTRMREPMRDSSDLGDDVGLTRV